MNDENCYDYRACRNLIITLLAEAVRSIVNEDTYADYSRLWLKNSGLAQAAFEEIGIRQEEGLKIIEGLRENGSRLRGRTVLMSFASYEKHKEHFAQARRNRKPESKPRRRWSKENGQQNL